MLDLQIDGFDDAAVDGLRQRHGDADVDAKELAVPWEGLDEVGIRSCHYRESRSYSITRFNVSSKEYCGLYPIREVIFSIEGTLRCMSSNPGA